MSAVVIEADFVQWLRDNQALAQRGAWPRYHAAFLDPPYSLNFMNSQWDNLGTAQQYQAWCKEWASMLLDFMFPGALLVAFGGSRTYHRLACGIEDAGWEIADSMRVALPAAWVQGQGFPKSLALDKAIDARLGKIGERKIIRDKTYKLANEGGYKGGLNTDKPRSLSAEITAPATPEAAQWDGYGTALSPSFESLVIARAPRGNHTYASLALTYGTGALAIDAARISTNGEERALLDATAKITPSQFGAMGGSKAIGITTLGRWPANFALVHDERCTTATCDRCHGAGRIALPMEEWMKIELYAATGQIREDYPRDKQCPKCTGSGVMDVCVDGCPVKALGEQSGEIGHGHWPHSDANIFGTLKGEKRRYNGIGHYDNTSSTAARFFYCAKSATWEREAGLDGFEANVPTKTSAPNRLKCRKCGGWQNVGSAIVNNRPNSTCQCEHPDYEPQDLRVNARRNSHPTLKPIQLTAHIATLLKPPTERSRILIPFSGVASEMIGCLLAGWTDITGIEQSAEYAAIARARLKWWSQFDSYDAAKARYDSEQRGRADDATKEAAGQLRLFGEAEEKSA